MFMFQRLGDQLVTLLDFNSNTSTDPLDMTHFFNLLVIYEGVMYGADPTIINDPPIE
jgi:predicted Zn-dependent protease with MMP-like domain